MIEVKHIDKLNEIGYTLKGLVALCSDIAEVKIHNIGEHTHEHYKILLLERIIADVLNDVEGVSKHIEDQFRRQR